MCVTFQRSVYAIGQISRDVFFYFRMATASTSSVAGNTIIDPYCETCFETKTEKSIVTSLCEDCNVFLCMACLNVHKKTPWSKKHKYLRGSRMPKSFADKPIKYQNCEFHTCNIKDRYCLQHHEMLCSECLKQNHKRCHTDTITNHCKFFGSDDIQSFTGVVDDIKLIVQHVQSKLQQNISDLTKERENEIKRAEQAKQDMIQKANELFKKSVSGITTYHDNIVGEIKSQIGGLDDQSHNLDEIKTKLNRKVSLKLDPNLFIQMQQIVNTTKTCKREIDDMISKIRITKMSFNFSDEILDFLACDHVGNVEVKWLRLAITDDVEDIFFPYIICTTMAGLPCINVHPKSKIYKPRDHVFCHCVARKMSHMNVVFPVVTSLVVTDNGSLLLVGGTLLKVFSPDSTLLGTLELPDICWSATVTCSDIVVVCFGESKFKFLEISDLSPISIRLISNVTEQLSDYEVLGMTSYKDKLVVTSINPPSVRMVEMKGENVWTVCKGSIDQQLFHTPRYVAASMINCTETVIVSDYGNERITLLKVNNGSLLKIIDMAGKDPRGIAVNNVGNIFVACGRARVIDVSSNNVTKHRTLIPSKDLKEDPRCIAYNSSTDTLYVSYYAAAWNLSDYDYIERFQLSYDG